LVDQKREQNENIGGVNICTITQASQIFDLKSSLLAPIDFPIAVAASAVLDCEKKKRVEELLLFRTSRNMDLFWGKSECRTHGALLFFYYCARGALVLSFEGLFYEIVKFNCCVLKEAAQRMCFGRKNFMWLTHCSTLMLIKIY